MYALYKHFANDFMLLCGKRSWEGEQPKTSQVPSSNSFFPHWSSARGKGETNSSSEKRRRHLNQDGRVGEEGEEDDALLGPAARGIRILHARGLPLQEKAKARKLRREQEDRDEDLPEVDQDAKKSK